MKTIMVRYKTSEAKGDANEALASFKAFQGQLKDRGVEPPVVTELPIVGSYCEVAP